MFLSANDKVVRAKKGSAGVHICKTTQVWEKDKIKKSYNQITIKKIRNIIWSTHLQDHPGRIEKPYLIFVTVRIFSLVSKNYVKNVYFIHLQDHPGGIEKPYHQKCLQDIPWITADIILQAVIISTYAEPTVPEQV